MNTEEMRKVAVDDLGLGNMSHEEQDKIIDEFTKNVMKKLVVALFERLPKVAQDEFIRLGDAGDSDAVLKIFQENIPDMEAVVQSEIKEEVQAFKDFQSGS